jgi:hypothetical protein
MSALQNGSEAGRIALLPFFIEEFSSTGEMLWNIPSA